METDQTEKNDAPKVLDTHNKNYQQTSGDLNKVSSSSNGQYKKGQKQKQWGERPIGSRTANENYDGMTTWGWKRTSKAKVMYETRTM